MDDHCGCVISYMYKYRMKLYISFLILVPIDARLPRAEDKTMQDVEHNTINKICKMSRPMSKGINLRGFVPSQTQTNIPRLGTPGQRRFYYKPQAKASLLSWPF